MIHFDRVTKSYPLRNSRKIILHELTATFPERNLGILGINGAGKSTLLKMIAGTELPNTGRIWRNARVSWPLGFAGSFHGAMTGAENVKFVARIYGQDTEYVTRFVEEFSELAEFFHMPVRVYSSGMKARLAFGVSMAIDFDYYLVDELTAVGDKRFKRRCRQMFKKKLINANIIMISHGPATLKKYCDTGAVIHNGELVFYDDLREALAAHRYNMRGLDESANDVGHHLESGPEQAAEI